MICSQNICKNCDLEAETNGFYGLLKGVSSEVQVQVQEREK